MTRGTILMAAIAAALCMQYTWAVQYDVGGRPGWYTSVDFKTWASAKRFTTGDTLVFKYSVVHSLVEVNKAGYDSCSAATAIKSYSDGNTAIVLSKAGKRYFISGSAGHCNAGMKLEVDTQLASAAVPSLAPAQVPVSSPAGSSRHHAHAHSPTAKIRASPSTSGAPAPVPSSRSSAAHAPTASATSPIAESGATGSHNYDDVVKNVMVVGAAILALVVL